MGADGCRCEGCRKVDAAAREKQGRAVEVGALVEVTLHGKVTGTSDSRGIYIETGDGVDTVSYWIPATSSVTVLSPPRPSEVLLLDCGHVVNEPRPSSTVGTVYCWRSPCHRTREVAQVGRVSW